MQALKVWRLSDSPSQGRFYLELNGRMRRVNRATWQTHHLGKRTDTHASRMETRKDGSVVVREFHCIRVKERNV